MKVKLSTIRSHPDNPRVIKDSDYQSLKKSIILFPEMQTARPMVVNSSNQIIGGNQRRRAFQDIAGMSLDEISAVIGTSTTPIEPERVTFLIEFWDNFKTEKTVEVHKVDWGEAKQKEFMIKDNVSNGEWNFDELANNWDSIELNDWGVGVWDASIADEQEPRETQEPTGELSEKQQATLVERFIMPPFSVLNARSGEWQERKRQWLALGINSETSRENVKVSGSLSGSVPDYFFMKEAYEKKQGHAVTNNEFEEKWLKEHLRNNKSSMKKTESGGILSVFDPVLCELAYKWFCTDKGKILDPFAGGSVRGIVANYLGYHYTGIDLRPEQIEANEEQGKLITPTNPPNWICGNSLNISNLAKEKYDLVFSCPPYYDLEIYSDNPNDLSNYKSYEDFINDYNSIIKQSVDLLEDNRFACFVVGDVRDKKGFYRNFVSDTIKAFQEAGATLYNEAILITTVGSLPIRVTKQFQSGRKLGKTHQNILVFYKGDPKAIKGLFGDVDNIDVFDGSEQDQ